MTARGMERLLVGIIVVLVVVVALLSATQHAPREMGPSEPPMLPARWAPLQPPRDDVECWYTGARAVCLPKKEGTP